MMLIESMQNLERLIALPELNAWPRHAVGLAVLGHPVAHSLSPLMHNSALKGLCEHHHEFVDWQYTSLDVKPENLAAALPLLSEKGFKGLNLTVPHKVQAVDLVSGLTHHAERMGAVNTLIAQEDGTWYGDNTDGYGLEQALKDAFPRLSGSPFKDKKVVLLGAGGAARGAAIQILSGGVGELWIGSRNEERRVALFEQMGASQHLFGFPINDPPSAIADAAILINATSLGLKEDDPSPIALDLFTSNVCVFDMIYNPACTALMRAGIELNLDVANGLGMLVWQGAASLATWTGLSEVASMDVRSFLAASMADELQYKALRAT